MFYTFSLHFFYNIYTVGKDSCEHRSQSIGLQNLQYQKWSLLEDKKKERNKKVKKKSVKL